MFKWRKIFKRLTLGLCGVFAAGVLFTGCGGGDGGGSSSSGGDPNVLKVGVTNFADTLEPTQNYFGWVVMRYGLGECLTKFDEKMNIQPWLAESWQVSDDHLTWTFKIRDNVKFSNGTPLTAEAVKNSIERAFAKNTRAATYPNEKSSARYARLPCRPAVYYRRHDRRTCSRFQQGRPHLHRPLHC